MEWKTTTLFLLVRRSNHQAAVRRRHVEVGNSTSRVYVSCQPIKNDKITNLLFYASIIMLYIDHASPTRAKTTGDDESVIVRLA